MPASIFRSSSFPSISTLSTMSWPVLLISVFVFYWVVSSVRSYLRLRHIKGPPFAAWSNLWYLRAAVSGRPHLFLSDACTQYGPLCRIGPNTLLTSDEELVRRISSVRSGYSRGDWYKAFRFDADRENLFSQTDEEKHMWMKNRVTAGYSGKDNPNLERDIDRVLWTFLDLIKSKYLSSGPTFKPCDIAEKLQFLTLDIITSLSLGQPFGWVANDQDMYEYIATLEANMPAMNFVSAVPVLAKIMRIPAIQRATLPSIKDKVGMGKIKGVAREILERRYGPDADKETRQDMTQSFIKHGLSQAEIADEGLLQILAGSDTSGTIMRAGLIYILSNHHVYTTLQAECDSAGVPLDEIISNKRSIQLPYLNAVLAETLRYHPAATGLMPKKVSPQGDTWKGVYLPPGTEIGLCAWNLKRLNSVYGEDAAVYRPDRWIEARSNPKRLAQMEKAHELVFGYGRYRCMGEKIARIEMLKILFELMRRFDFSFVNPDKPLTSSINYGLWIQKGLWLRVEERNSGSAAS